VRSVRALHGAHREVNPAGDATAALPAQWVSPVAGVSVGRPLKPLVRRNLAANIYLGGLPALLLRSWILGVWVPLDSWIPLEPLSLDLICHTVDGYWRWVPCTSCVCRIVTVIATMRVQCINCIPKWTCASNCPRGDSTWSRVCRLGRSNRCNLLAKYYYHHWSQLCFAVLDSAMKFQFSPWFLDSKFQYCSLSVNWIWQNWFWYEILLYCLSFWSY
jgi:hypothetical protein